MFTNTTSRTYSAFDIKSTLVSGSHQLVYHSLASSYYILADKKITLALFSESDMALFNNLNSKKRFILLLKMSD